MSSTRREKDESELRQLCEELTEMKRSKARRSAQITELDENGSSWVAAQFMFANTLLKKIK